MAKLQTTIKIDTTAAKGKLEELHRLVINGETAMKRLQVTAKVTAKAMTDCKKAMDEFLKDIL